MIRDVSMSGTKYQVTVLGVSLRVHVCVHVSYNRCEQQKLFRGAKPRALSPLRTALRSKYVALQTRALVSNLRPRAPGPRARALGPWRQTCHLPPLFLPSTRPCNSLPARPKQSPAGIESAPPESDAEVREAPDRLTTPRLLDSSTHKMTRSF